MANVRKKKLFNYALQAAYAISKLRNDVDELQRAYVDHSRHIQELMHLMSKKKDIELEPVHGRKNAHNG